MRVLLSIKPEYANKIFSGEKKWEFRRSIFKNQNIKKVVVYASSPVKMVIGEFEIDRILTENVPNLWRKTEEHAGISEAFFSAYFANKEKGYAIKVKTYRLYKKPLCIKADFKLHPPQSFVYIHD